MPETIAERFARDTADHQMTVLRDEGLYRHLRFRRTDRSSYWFDLITWPGCLTITGDCGTFTFARTTDMFEFFRDGPVNPQYWAEKVRARDISGETTRYSEEKFRRQVMEDAAVSEADWPGLTAEVEKRIFGREAEWDHSHESEARRALDEFRYLPAAAPWSGFEPFAFTDTWEWDLADWDWQFLWCCHALQWGISVYDKQRADDLDAAYRENAEREAPVHA